MYKYVINHIPIIKGKRPGIKATMTTITIHNTGNPDSTALNERNWLTSSLNTRAASFHIVVDSIQATECIPLTEVAYHSGTNKGNNTSIGIEICESGDYKQNEENAIDLVAKMLVERGWGTDRLRRHYDWNGKNCPRLIMLYWDDFKYRIYKKIIELGGKSVKPILSLGSKGEAVKDLQRNLVKLGYNIGKWGADGDFGNDTVIAVKAFQKDYDLIVDGEVGEKTWTKLSELLAPIGQPVDGNTSKYKNILIMIRNSINEVLGE